MTTPLAISSLRSNLRSKKQDLEQELTYIRQENTLLKQQLALTEDATRTLFLRVEGLFEKSGENLLTYVASTLSWTGISCSIDDLDYVKRIGRYRQGATRPVLVKFVREHKRTLILYNRANLNRNTNSLIWINDDVSDYTRRQRKTVRDIAANAKIIGQTDLKVHGDGLVLGNGKFKHQDLDLLPPHLSIATAKQPCDESDLYFQSEFSPLSNFFSSPIIDENETHYTSSEQFFQHKKALFHGYTLTADKILRTRDPYELKRLGNKVTQSQEWKDMEEETMLTILRAKFLQNPNLYQILIDTGSLHLHEASADHKWSTGAELASKALQMGSWPGQDRMGFLLEKLCAELQGITLPDSDELPPNSSTPPPPEKDDLTPIPDDEDDLDNTSPPHTAESPQSFPLPPPTSQPPPPHVLNSPHNNQSMIPTTLPPPPSTLTTITHSQSPTPRCPNYCPSTYATNNA